MSFRGWLWLFARGVIVIGRWRVLLGDCGNLYSERYGFRRAYHTRWICIAERRTTRGVSVLQKGGRWPL